MTSKIEKFRQMGDLLRFYFVFSRRFYGEEVKLTSLTPQQGRTLMYIEDHPGVIQRQLADTFHLRNASVTNMLKNLERDGYLERKQDPKSARIKRLYLTDAGKQEVIKMKKSFDKILRKLSARVDESLLDQLIPLLQEFNKQIQK
ncbi:MarR family winged helix-turn-helix transcriptional regulator [uncultured Lactobacillus sp.]|uniref:MarR family winged helix-turn-helix transcriptional regulator n=1 Tax=uncultured Lactobacillus sp. TaxID=153152 RepID=UPI00260C590A|nr:MarR family transcriptional regulator [uncultured Lactobacillus sp.]